MDYPYPDHYTTPAYRENSGEMNYRIALVDFLMPAFKTWEPA
jgi:hypothetical protein